MKKVFGVIAISAACVAARAEAQPAAAVALRPVAYDCQRSYTPVDKRISACTLLIEATFMGPRSLGWLYLFRGQAYADKGDPQEALADFTTAIARMPESADAWSGAADALLREGKTGEASSNFERAGYFFLKTGRCTKAEESYNQALKINSKLAAALYGRGLCEKQKGDANAQIDLAAALAADPAIATRADWPN